MAETKKNIKSKEINSSLSVLNLKGKEVEKIGLNPKVFDGEVNRSLLHQAVVAYLANQRKGLAATKTRGEVRGGGKKPWRQKGTGRARVGSNRSPLWKGGGVTFGPKPRSYRKDLSKKMKVLAFKSALNAKLIDQEIIVVEDLKVDSHKTKNTSEIINNLGIKGIKTRLVVGGIESNLKLSARNIDCLALAKASDVSAKEIIDCRKLLLTKEALKTIEGRIEKWIQ